MATAFSQQLAQLEDETKLSRMALDAGLSKRFKHLREGTSGLDRLHNLQDNLDVLFGDVIQALDKENDFLKVYIRNALPADLGNVDPASTGDLQEGTHSLSKQAEGRAYENSQFASSKPMEPVPVGPSKTSGVASNSGNENGSTHSKSTSKQRQIPPKFPARFPCTDCGKRFTRPTTLREHMRSHSNERPFQCSLCPKNFARLKDMKRHQLLHLNEMKYICEGIDFNGEELFGCKRRFAREDGLLAHWRTKTGWACLVESVDMGKTGKVSFINIEQFLSSVEEESEVHCTNFIDEMMLIKYGSVGVGTSRECGCEKSYQSIRDLWNLHLSLDEGKDCLKELLVYQALESSKAWAHDEQEEGSEFEDRSEPKVSQTIPTNEEDTQIAIPTSTSSVTRVANLQETEWKVCNCWFNKPQQRVSVLLEASYRMDPAEISIRVDYQYFRAQVTDVTWANDNRKCLFNWTVNWKDRINTANGIMDGFAVLRIGFHQKEAVATLGHLVIEGNQLSEFQTADFSRSFRFLQ